MRRKQTLNIAGMELSVVTDAEPSVIEQSVGMVDRTIREIRLKSVGCSTTEAALLCALDSNAERISFQGQFLQCQEQVKKDQETIEELRHRVEELESENATLRSDNKVMQDILSKAATGASLNVPVTEENTAFEPTEETPVADATLEDPSPEPEEVPEESAKETPEPPQPARKAPRPKNKSHVGSMFDLLTFDDV